MLGFKCLKVNRSYNVMYDWPISPVYSANWKDLKIKASCHILNIQMIHPHDRETIHKDCECGVHVGFDIGDADIYFIAYRAFFLVRSCGFTEFVHKRGFRADEVEIVAVIDNVPARNKFGLRSAMYKKWIADYNEVVAPTVAERWGLPVIDHETAKEMVDEDLRMRSMQNREGRLQEDQESREVEPMLGMDE